MRWDERWIEVWNKERGEREANPSLGFKLMTSWLQIKLSAAAATVTAQLLSIAIHFLSVAKRYCLKSFLRLMDQWANFLDHLCHHTLKKTFKLQCWLSRGKKDINWVTFGLKLSSANQIWKKTFRCLFEFHARLTSVRRWKSESDAA